LDKVSSSIVGLSIHAGRRAEEMDELKRTFNHFGHEIFYGARGAKSARGDRRIAAPRRHPPAAQREGELFETLERFYEMGLLRNSPEKENS
jgi:hypothetical protein